MALPPEFDQPAGSGLRRVDEAIDRGQSRVFRVLWFLVPSGSIARNPNFQALLASRFLSDLALQALLFGVLIASVRNGGDAFEAAIIGVAYLLPGVALGLFGGVVADWLPKRFALVAAYLLMGVLSFSLPLVLGFELRGMIAVLFAVRVLHQVSQPSEASAVPLVATNDELASANSFLSLASSAGEVVGKALLAPLLVRAFDIEPVVFLAGGLFILSATRAFRFKVEPGTNGELEELEALEYLEAEEAEPPEPVRKISTRQALRWLINEPAAFWMLMLAAMASTTGVVLGVLGPRYVFAVLDVPPENTFYVFAPASLGLIVALVLAPILIKIFKERLIAALGFLLVAVGMAALGMIERTTDVLGDRVLLFDIPGVGEQVEMAAAISLLLGTGMTLAAAATMTYIGKYVPSEVHGRMFALLGAMKDGLSIPVLLLMGAVSGFVGVDNVLLVSPLVLIGIAFGIDAYIGRWRAPEQVDGPVIDRI
jgi:MFS family permease